MGDARVHGGVLVHLAAVAPLLAGCSASPSAQQGLAAREGETYGAILFHAGERELRDEVWEPVERQTALGFTIAAASFEEGLGMQFQYFEGRGDADEDEPGSGVGSSTSRHHEVGFGLWLPIETHTPLMPYVGFGALRMWARFESAPPGIVAHSDDVSNGGFANAGLLFRIGAHLVLGVEARVVFGTRLEIQGERVDADYGQVSAVLGWAF